MRGASSRVPLSFLLAVAACGSRTGLYALPPNDASPDDAPLDGSAPYDGTILDAPDAPDVEAASDAHVDGADAPDAFSRDSGGPEAGTVVAPRPIAPLSTSRVTRHRPTFHWQLEGADDGAFVEICADRPCATVVTSFEVKGTSGAPATALHPGIYFWRLHGTDSGTIGTATSPTWEVRVPVEDTAVDSSWGTFLDIDGDGYADLAIGAETASSMSDEGAAYVQTGGPHGAAPPLVTFVAPYEWYSVSVLSAGDVDGDGFADLIVGSTSPLDQQGAILVYRGGPAWASSAPLTLAGPAGQMEFGASITSAGDVNGDGYADIAGSAITPGDVASVYLYLGGPAGLSGPTTVLPGGGVVAPVVASDINGDGLSDVVVAVNPMKGQATGSMDVYYGAPGGLSATPISFTVPGDPTQFALQATLSSVGDMNGDGYGDVAWTVPYMATGVDVHFGGPHGLSTTALSIPDPGGSNFGMHGAPLGDINGDGFDDLAIPDPQLGGGGTVSIYLGASSPGSQPSFAIGAPMPTTSWIFGGAVAALGDFDGDGYDDVGIRDSDDTGGQALVYFGNVGGISSSPQTVAAPEGGVAWFGLTLARRLRPLGFGVRRRR